MAGSVCPSIIIVAAVLLQRNGIVNRKKGGSSNCSMSQASSPAASVHTPKRQRQSPGAEEDVASPFQATEVADLSDDPDKNESQSEEEMQHNVEDYYKGEEQIGWFVQHHHFKKVYADIKKTSDAEEVHNI